MLLPVLLIALGLGAFAAYELSPKTQTWVDDHLSHAKAANDAATAHKIAEDSLRNAAAWAAIAANERSRADAQQASLRRLQEQVAVPIVPTTTAPASSPIATTSPATAAAQATQTQVVATVQSAANSQQKAADAEQASIQHTQVATAANQVAAEKTVEVAKTAKTEPQKQVAADSASAVIDRQNRIAALLKQLGTGECGMRPYKGVTAKVKDALIAKLRSKGMKVTTTVTNLFDIDAHKADVKLRALWEPGTGTIYIIVSNKAWYAPCDSIWSEIEPALKEVVASA